MIYLDSAAVVKLAHAEAESPALRAWLDGLAETGWVSSVLTEIESFRALARYAPDSASRLPAVLDQIELIDLDPPIQILAQTVRPATVRSLSRAGSVNIGDEPSADGAKDTERRIRSKPFDTPSNAIQNVRREQHRQRRSRELAHRGPGGHRRAGQLAMPGATRGDDADRRLTDRSEIDGAFVRHPPQAVLPDRGPAGAPRPARPLASDTDWEEIRELVTDSYRRLAPKKLTALLDQQRRQ